MKKLLLSSAFIAALATSANAQLPVGSVAPDFTLTDIEGNTHNLYDYLDEGYTVLIDISAAWCGPCWSAHESGFMKTLYNQYGPSGTIEAGKLMVLFVEGESGNTEAQLHGTSGSGSVLFSQGDWVTGEPYPIIDNASLNTTYDIGGFPTFTLVCPNRRVGFSTAGFGAAMAVPENWVPLIDDCPVPVSGTNVGTINVTTQTIACVGEPVALKTEIQNLGSTTLTSATVTAKVEGTTVATFTWSGSLAPLASAVVTVGEYTFSSTKTVDYEVTTSGDVEAGDNSRSLTTTAMASTFRTWNLEVKTDPYPGETSWKLKDDAGAVVEEHTYVGAAGGAAGGADASKTFNHVFNLDANKCYTLEVRDAYGDGLYGVSSAADTGYIRLKDGAGAVIYSYGGGYGGGYDIIAKTGSTLDMEDLIAVNGIKVYPNPVADELTVSFDVVKSTKVTFNVVNILGQQMNIQSEQTMSAGPNSAKINTANLAPGMYFVNISTTEGTVQQKFIKK